MRKRWSLWLTAGLGFVVGGAASIYGVATGPPKPDAQTAGSIVGGFVWGSVFFVLVAAIRNWAVGARK
jgi:hypothetical protein